MNSRFWFKFDIALAVAYFILTIVELAIGQFGWAMIDAIICCLFAVLAYTNRSNA